MTLTVYHKTTGSFQLFDNTNGSQVTINKGEQKMTLMEEDVVTLELSSAIMLPFAIGDYITVYEKKYKLNEFPIITKTANKRFKYNVTFEGVHYDLINTAFLLGKDTMLDSLSGDIDTFIALIVSNANRVYPGKWAAGTTIEGSVVKNLTFTDKNCLEALQMVCEEYDTEFDITTVSNVNYINIREREVFFTTPFSIGKTGGLYSIKRLISDTYPLVTRLFAFGSNENLGNSYRHTRLCLPSKTKDTSYLETSISGQPYGIKEAVKVFEEIKPERTGTISNIDGAFSFYDSSMNFDLNEKWRKRNVMYYVVDTWYNDYTIWLTKRGLTDTTENQTIYDDGVYGTTKWLIGEDSKVHFQTGDLAGYEFDIVNYDHSTKKFRIKQFEDENGYKFPDEANAAFQFNTGDTYILLNITLPDSYITDAETRLNTEAAKYFSVSEKPLFKYEIDISPMYIKILRVAAGNAVNLFTVGDYAKIIDSDFAVNDYYRIIEYTRSILNSNEIKITLSDKRGFNMWEAVFETSKANKEAISRNKLEITSKPTYNFKSTSDVHSNVFSIEGNLISGVDLQILPESSATIDGQLFFDSSNTVKIFKVTKIIETDKENDEIYIGQQTTIIAYISPNTPKESDIEASVSANLQIISETESYDTNNNLILTVIIQGNSASETGKLTLTSSTDSSVTKDIPIVVNNLPEFVASCPNSNNIEYNTEFNFNIYLNPNDYPNINTPEIEGDIQLLGFSQYSDSGFIKYNVSVKGTVSESSGLIRFTSNEFPTVQKTITFNII